MTEDEENTAKRTVTQGLKYIPFTKAQKIVAGIWYDINDRAGIKHEFRSLDKDVQEDIFSVWMDIVNVVLDSDV